jgi:hypothetical protein
MPKKKPTQAELAQSRKRAKKRKALRLKREAERNKAAEARNRHRIFANIIGIRRQDPKPRGEEEAPPGEIVFGMRTGLFGHPTTTVLRIPDEKIVGALEDTKELGEIVTQVGLLTLGALFKYNLAFGPDELAVRMARWCGIDVAKLQVEAQKEKERAAQEAEAQAGNPAEGPDSDSLPSPTPSPAGSTEPDAHLDLGGEA